jgi:putative ABC transport system permease protein
MITELLTRLRFLLVRKTHAEVDEELRFHFEHLIQAKIAAGMSPEEARRQAAIVFGGVERMREECDEQRPGWFLETLVQDVRYGLRMMRKNPMFALTVILTLAIAIGGNAAMFTVIRGVLFKPLEYHDPDRLVRLSLEDLHENKRDGAFSLKRVEEMRASANSFSAIGAFLKLPENVSFSGYGEPEALVGARVSANFLDILGVQPLAGRGFLAEEDVPGGAPVAIISARLWKRRFQGDPQVVGKTATLDATPYTIIGVLPESFVFPFAGTDVWFTRPAEWSVVPGGAWLTILNGFARLKTDVSLSQAQTELELLNRQYVLANPDRMDARAGVSIRLTPLKEQFIANVRPTLWMLFGAVIFVLLIACANVAGLLLARATYRSREFALRAALGAACGRLVRQLLAESMVLAMAGGCIGSVLAVIVLYLIKHFNALDLPRIGEIRLDGIMLGFTLALSTATGVLFGLFPSLQASRRDLAVELRESGAGVGRGSTVRRRILGVSARGLLVIGQISLSIVLLIGATLLLKSFARLLSVDPGFQSANLLTMQIALPPTRYDTNQKKAAFFGELIGRFGAVPGVDSAAVALSLPTTKGWLGTNVLVEGQPAVDDDKAPTARFQSITPSYFHTLKIPLRRGREFTARDNSPGAQPVVIINESFALRFWPAYPRGQDPVGQHIWDGIDRTGGMTIVGIVGDVHQEGLATESVPEFYVPTVMHAPQTAYLAVRTERDPLLLVGAVRNQVLTIDQDQPVSDVSTMDDVLAANLGQRRLTMFLLGSFACVALLLAVIGIYGLIAYSVGQRTQELGIRQALGAERGQILQLVLSQGLSLALVGIAIGVGAAFALTRVLKNLLFHVSATDPVTFFTIALLFVIVTFVASYIPARRATLVDAMAALRVE